MGVDYLKRFDWALAARIQRMGADELARLLEDRLPIWRNAIRRPESEALDLALRAARPVAAVLRELLAEGCTLTELRNDAIHDLCLQGEDVPLDGSGAWAEVFLEQPDQALSSLDLLPGTDEERFVLLRPQHLDAVLRSLEGRDLVPEARRGAAFEALARLRDACSARPGLLVAYCFDA